MPIRGLDSHGMRKAGVCRSGRQPWGADRGEATSSIARERARKIASKNRSSTTTGIGGSFQLANSAPPLGVTGSASAPTARMGMGHGPRAGASNTRLRRSGQEVPVRQFPRRGSRPWRECNARARATLAPSKPDGQASPEKNCCDKMTVTWTVYQLSH